MSQQMHPEFVDGGKSFRAKRTLVFSLAVMTSYMFSDNRVHCERSWTVRTVKNPIGASVGLDMVLQHQYLVEQLPAHRAFEDVLIL